MIDYDKFRMSLKRLEEQHENYRTLDRSLPGLIEEAVAESVIQRFKICYGCLWKVLKRYLIHGLGIADTPNSPKPIFRLANENGLFVACVQKWLRYADARLDTTHDYDGQKAKACLAIMPDFIEDAVGLYQTMSEIAWE